jgi:hypothetical protein
MTDSDKVQTIVMKVSKSSGSSKLEENATPPIVTDSNKVQTIVMKVPVTIKHNNKPNKSIRISVERL